MTSGQVLKDVIQHAADMALRYWRDDAFGDAFQKGSWYVAGRTELTVYESGEEVRRSFIAILGPTSDGGQQGAEVTVFPKNHMPVVNQRHREILATVRRLPSARSVFIKYSRCALFWPLGKNPHAWAKAQIGIWALQRPWVHTEEDEAWVWMQCLEPVMRLHRAGREALESGALGYEFQKKLTTNFLNPIHPGGFQRFIKETVTNVARRQIKKDHPWPRPHPLWDWDRFFMFLRQRRKRGHPGIVLNKEGRLSFVNDKVREELMTEYAEIVARKDFIDRFAKRMVEHGASEASARRQLRRWLQKPGSPETTQERYLAWKERRARNAE